MLAGTLEALRTRTRGFGQLKTPDSMDLGVESLESRLLLAGDVSVSVSGDNITIRGDNDGNDIIIFRVDGAGVFVTGAIGTTVNGSSDQFATGVLDVNNLTIKMRGGDDSVVVDGTLDPLGIGNNLKITTGKGEDLLIIRDVVVGNNLTAKTCGDADDVRIERIFVGRNLNVRTGSGEDLISLDDFDVGNNADIRSGSDGDEVMLFNGDVDGNFTLTTCTGSDFIELDVVSVGGSTNINAGGDRDIATVTDLFAAGNANISMGSGNDDLFVAGILLNGSRNNVRMCGGNDELNMDFEFLAGTFDKLTLDGNGGDDVLDTLGFVGPLPSNVTVRNFETIV